MQLKRRASGLTLRRAQGVIEKPDSTTEGAVDSDLKCVTRVLAGDGSAFETIVRRWDRW